MELYMPVKHIHMLTAYITALLLFVRLGLDVVGRPGWRTTPLRWIPHANDTLLLITAVALIALTGWKPFVHFWLTMKVVLLVGYIVAGVFAVRPNFKPWVRTLAAVLAFVQLAAIFHFAMSKPLL